MALRSRRGMFELPQGDSVTTTDPMTPSVSTEPTITRNLFLSFCHNQLLHHQELEEWELI